MLLGRNNEFFFLKIDFILAGPRLLKNSYFIRVSRLWNNLPLRIRELETLSLFCSNLIEYYYQMFEDNLDI